MLYVVCGMLLLNHVPCSIFHVVSFVCPSMLTFRCLPFVDNVTIMDVYLSSIQLGLSSKHLLNPDVLQTITQTAADRKDQ